MSLHRATVAWTLVEGEDFAAGRYGRAHVLRFDHGVEVAGSASPLIVPPPWSRPDAVDPEAAFIAALSACHMLWFLDFARREGWVVEAYEDRAEGTLARIAAGRMAITKVALRPAIRFRKPPDAAVVARLHHLAHEACFIANSVTTEVVVES